MMKMYFDQTAWVHLSQYYKCRLRFVCRKRLNCNEQAYQALRVLPNRLETPKNQPTFDISTAHGALRALPGGSALGTNLG